MLTSDDLAAIRERAAAATEGPWTWASHTTADGDEWAVFDPADHALASNRDGWAPDAEFIAHAREDVPALLAEVERLRAIEAGIEALHRPVHPVFSWEIGLRFEEPCPDCHGRAGVHPCGCWADEDTQYECLECAQPKGGGSRRVAPWPCPTAALLDPTEGES